MRKILAVSLVLLFVAGTAAAACLEILDEFIPPGDENTPYSHQMSVYGGSGGPYTWSIYAGSLPAGLSLSSSGLISGTPTAAGYTLVYIQVSDNANPSCTDTRAYFVEVF